MSSPFEDLQKTIHTLRSPGGCPWDRKQTLVSASRYLMDEGGELVEAALEGKNEDAAEELGDLMFMTFFCTRILGEEMDLDIHDVARMANEKLIRRHPHVFQDGGTECVTESQERWNQIKDEEKRAKGLDPDKESALKDMPASTAPLHQAYIYQDNAADVGFDWPALDGVWRKLQEETDEVREAAESGDTDHLEHEIGDLLFSVVNLARWFKIQPDMALRKANRRFRDRFQLVEEAYRSRGEDMRDADIEELEASWQAAKKKLEK
jgi:tetrapyrrole methylase family protein/MazG family protein